MQNALEHIILETTEASAISHIEKIQDLWSGYGEVLRIELSGYAQKSVIIKYIQLPEDDQHPQGWSGLISQQRKINSYQVEKAWYQQYAYRCQSICPMPTALKVTSTQNDSVIIMSDLKQQGFSTTKTCISLNEAKSCLNWLANFHAYFMLEKTSNLWREGSYWHLATREQELKALGDKALKRAALSINNKLSNSPYQTLIHGDAKLANFCFSENDIGVAAVDFQYTGHGCGMKDVAYFIGSCFNADECKDYESVLLNNYFSDLSQALEQYHPQLDASAIEHDWRPLYDFACADFQRFIKAWSPNHWKTHDYSEAITARVLKQLQSDKLL